jgi:hypothetical protein
MNQLRLMLGYVVLALLALGYLSSQYFYLTNEAQTYAARVDVPQVKWLSLALLLMALVLFIIPGGEVE